jgi:hypothetical protein
MTRAPSTGKCAGLTDATQEDKMTTRWSTRTKKVALGAGVLLTSLGLGGTAFAATTSTGGQTPTPAATAHHHPKLRAMLRHSVQDTRVVSTKNGYVTIESVRGTVDTVSTGSISVTAANGAELTATIGSTTRFVRITQASIAPGDKVGLVAVGSTARLIVGPKASTTPSS